MFLRGLRLLGVLYLSTVPLLAQIPNLPRPIITRPVIGLTKFDAILLDLHSDGLNVSGQTTTALATGSSQRVRWTMADTDDAFLTADASALRAMGIELRRANGVIADGVTLAGGGFSIKTADGSSTVAADGWHVLARLDTNRDGRLNASDAPWKALRCFVDANADGTIGAAELTSTLSCGLREIRFGAGSARTDQFGNTIVDGTFVRADGSTAPAADVFFSN
jgi:hypothetical protein